MKPAIAAVLAAGLLACSAGTSAHRLDEYLQATLLSIEADRIGGSMRMIPGEIVAQSVIADIDADRDGSFSTLEQQAYAKRVLDDQSITVGSAAIRLELLSWDFPTPDQVRAGLGEIHIDYAGQLAGGPGEHALVLANRHMPGRSVYLANVLVPRDPAIEVTAQTRNRDQSRYALGYRLAAGGAGVAGAGATQAGAWWDGLELARLFRLGLHHIAEGTDHLLFLLVLLLPAPLLTSSARWGPAAGVRRTLWRVLGIVTAFTIGHSLTLALSVLAGVSVPARPVEVLIAMSILVSAVHAGRPLFPGREPWVAGAFGLVHGLAFAATLDRLGLGAWERVAGTLAFNAGIEAMQLLVVAAVLPTLVLLAPTRGYAWIRNGGALFAAAAALGWLVERLFDVSTPVDAIVHVLARQAPLLAAAGLVVGLLLRMRQVRLR
jgi:hypothetical protein